ncbi:MAG: hypothetical protein ABL871_13340 [Terricaulis sp.]
MPRWTTLGLFVVFLIGYTFQKYAAAAPPTFVPDYLRIVLVIVFITAIIPFVVMWPAGGLVKPFPLFAAFTVIGCIGLSALAFAGFWYFTVSQYPNAPPVWELVPRGIAPGLFMATILVFDRWLSQRSQRGSVAP